VTYYYLSLEIKLCCLILCSITFTHLLHKICIITNNVIQKKLLNLRVALATTSTATTPTASAMSATTTTTSTPTTPAVSLTSSLSTSFATVITS